MKKFQLLGDTVKRQTVYACFYKLSLWRSVVLNSSSCAEYKLAAIFLLSFVQPTLVYL